MMLLFLKIAATEFIAEMGDKTQLMLIAMSSRYKLRDILLGTAAAILVLNGIAVLAGGLVSSFIPTWLIRLAAAAAFLYFALSSLQPEEAEGEHMAGKKTDGLGEHDFGEENDIRRENDGENKGKSAGSLRTAGFAPAAVFGTFFLAELGDKTQLTAITFGANEGMQSALIVWLACSAGLFAADILGMLAGYFLLSRMPEGFLGKLAFGIFSVYGILTLRQGLALLLPGRAGAVWILTAGAALIFTGLCLLRLRK